MIDHGDPAGSADWSGGFYELAIDCRWTREELQRALDALVGSGCFDGVWRGRNAATLSTPREELTEEMLREDGEATGVLRLEGGATCLALVCALWNEDGSIWSLTLGMPMRSLDLAVKGGTGAYPFGELLVFTSLDAAVPAEPASLRWRRPLDRQLAALAERIFAAVPFDLARIGFEPDAIDVAAFVQALEVPTPRHETVLWPRDGALAIRFADR